MRDVMKMGDGLAIGLTCGHPHKKPGEKCELCGKVVPDPENALKDLNAKGEKVGNVTVYSDPFNDNET